MNRYHRQIIIKSHGLEGQERLKNSKVLVVGCGGLGSPIAVYLASCGIGKLCIIDGDVVSSTNLHRQVWYQERDLGKYKAVVLSEFIREQNPDIQLIHLPYMLDKTNAAELISGYDIVVDGSDNFFTRYLINDVCVENKIPLVFGAIYQYEGQVCVFNTYDETHKPGPNYRDIFPDHTKMSSIQNCNEAGVIGVLPGIIGTLQAMEVINLIVDGKSPLEGKLLTVDAKTMNFTKIKLNKTFDNSKINHQKTNYYMYSSSIQSIDKATYDAWVQNQLIFQLIDVRSKEEFEYYNINGINIPLNEIVNNISNIKTDIPVLFVCQSGARSKEAINQVKANSNKEFNNLYNLEGGLSSF